MAGPFYTLILFFYLSLSLVFGLPASPSSETEHAARHTSLESRAGGSYINAAYFVDWYQTPSRLSRQPLILHRAIYARNFQPQSIPATQLTHVLYAFADITNLTGEVYAQTVFHLNQQTH